MSIINLRRTTVETKNDRIFNEKEAFEKKEQAWKDDIERRLKILECDHAVTELRCQFTEA